MSEETMQTFEVVLPPSPPKSKFEQERNAFRQLLPGLLPTHCGKYVVIHGGQIVDEGSDPIELTDRVLRRIGYTAIYVGLVAEEQPIYRLTKYREGASLMSVLRFNYVPLAVPTPLIYAEVRCPFQGVAAAQRPALIDSGADRSVLPGPLVRTLGLVRVGEIHVQGFGGGVSTVPVTQVQILIVGRPPVTAQTVIGEDEPYIILGRDVLNHFRILLDGPGLAVEFH